MDELTFTPPTLRVKVICAECDRLLEVVSPNGRQEVVIRLAPCEHCLNERARVSMEDTREYEAER